MGAKEADLNCFGFFSSNDGSPIFVNSIVLSSDFERVFRVAGGGRGGAGY